MAKNLNDEYAPCIAALQAVKLIGDTHGWTTEGCRLAADVLRGLETLDSGGGPYGGLSKNIANAISRAIFLRDLSAVT